MYRCKIIGCIGGQDAVQWLCAKKNKIGIPEANFEHLSFTDGYGINVHLSKKENLFWVK